MEVMKQEMKEAVCELCGYTFFDPSEKDKEFVYVDDKPYCLDCLKDVIAMAEDTRKLANQMMSKRIERMPRVYTRVKDAAVIVEES
jgi:hypothetical protein